jgi:protein-disulfide isomerase
VPLLEQVLEQYPKDVKLVFKQFPLGNHKFAGPAALVSLAANEQGKFWPLHDLIFANYNQLNDQKLNELAKEAGLDMDRYEKDLKANSQRYLSIVRRDMQEGQRNGVRGTPSIFVNGRQLKQRSLPGFKAAIEKELAKKGK